MVDTAKPELPVVRSPQESYGSFVDEAYIDYLPDPGRVRLHPDGQFGANIIVAMTFSGFRWRFCGSCVAATRGTQPDDDQKTLPEYTEAAWCFILDALPYRRGGW